MIFTFKRIGLLTLLLGVFLLNFSCNKAETILDPALPKGGMALTFDDYSIDNWHKYMHLLDSLNVKATFYISNYNKLNHEQKKKLHELQNHGHEIAFHSTNHVNFLKYANENKCDKLLQEEVLDGLKLMNNDGFFPTTFAYPYGQHNEILDKLLLKYFKSVRALNGTQNLAKSLTMLEGNRIIYGLGIDESSKRDFDKLKDLLTQAQQKNNCAVLLIHNIERRDITMQCPLWKLKELILHAQSLNLKFYTISEISN
ncbi:MAG: polysaccharide deacetylase family protein [Bacteroidota bacterium]|nr:polysaccharide deacetylase family protein [Bacteroidota bacterium]